MGSDNEPPTDRHNDPTGDPTSNVFALVQAESRRQDDLREHEADSLRREAQLRADYDDKLRAAETARIDAIRAVDVAAVQRASEVAAQQAMTLAQQVSTTADAFRTTLSAALEPITASISDLRRAQYEAQGQKTQVVESTSRSGNIGAWVFGGAGLVIGIVAILISILGGQ